MQSKFYFSCLTALFLAVACQSDPPVDTETVATPDTLSWSISSIDKSIPCKEKMEEPCLKVSIQKMNITAGTSEEAMQKIEDVLARSISETDNSEQPAPNAEAIANNLFKEYQRIITEMPEYKLPWTYTRTFEVYLNCDDIFGVKLNAYSFTGGAHPATFTYYYNFNASTGNLLKLQDLLVPKSLPRFISMAERKFRKVHSLDSTASLEDAGFWFENNAFALNNNFSYSLAGIEFVYNPYEIAAYSEGTITLTFPYTDIEGMLKPKYRLHKKEASL